MQQPALFGGGVLAFVLLGSSAAAQCFDDRAALSGAAGPPNLSESFSGFTADTPFDAGAVDLRIGSIEALNGTGFRNFIETPPFQFGDNNGTNHASCYTNADFPATVVEVRPYSPVDSFGCDIYQGCGLECVEMAVYSGSTLLFICPVVSNDLPLQPLRPGEGFPPKTLLVVTDTNAARPVVQDAVKRTIQQLEKIDEIYPKSAEYAHHIARLYGLLMQSIDRFDKPRPQDVPQLRLLSDRMVRWANEAIARGSTVSTYHMTHGDALWRAGRHQSVALQIDLYRDGIQSFRTAHALAPINPAILLTLGGKQEMLGRNLATLPRFKAEGERLLRESRENKAKGHVMHQYRQLYTAKSIR